MSDTIFIDYDVDPDEKDLTAKDLDPDFYVFKPQKLREVFVDPGYEMEMLTPIQQMFLDELRKKFAERLDEPISYPELESAMHQIGNDTGQRIHKIRIIHFLRYMWRVGEIRRFVTDVLTAIRRRKPGRGESAGIYYILRSSKNKSIARS